ncbi:hypothetical protein ACWGFX_30350, partial [Streptomyces xanthophaeus]
MDIVSGVVSVAYSHFYIAEHVEEGAESVDNLPDFHTDEPVIVTRGMLTIVSCVQEHDAWVTLMVAEAEPVQQTEQWQSLGSWPYRPVHRGRMGISGVASVWRTSGDLGLHPERDVHDGEHAEEEAT